jgi:hypothetical protein
MPAMRDMTNEKIYGVVETNSPFPATHSKNTTNRMIRFIAITIDLKAWGTSR